MFKRVNVIILDSVGIGELPDADLFGDKGSNTLAHIIKEVPSIKIPNLKSLGLGNIASLSPIEAVDKPKGICGKMACKSIGKDTVTGHWELMGLNIDKPFQVFPEGFPKELLDKIKEFSGRGILGNKPASGTEIIDEFGEIQMKTGDLIVYTSADPVLQIAAHEEIIPLEELYRICKYVREITTNPPYMVGRIIARPYVGTPGNFTRTGNRHDYAIEPFAETLLDSLKNKEFDVISVGKINDIFSGKGITKSYPTKSNLEGIKTNIEMLKEQFSGLLFTNLVDFDSAYGHRRDVKGYAKCLEEFDEYLPQIMEGIGEDDLLVITADHGNDPTHSGTDHTREYVPILMYNPTFANKGISSIGVRETFADLAATISENFGVGQTTNGNSFLNLLR